MGQITEYSGTWIKFIPANLAGLTTANWRVDSIEDGFELGYVKFHPRWRKYIYEPLENTIYEQDCLRDIAQFCQDRTKEFWASKKKAKA